MSEFTLPDHLRLAFPQRAFIASGGQITFADDGPLPSEEELEATRAAALAAWQAEQAANSAATAGLANARSQMAAIMDGLSIQQQATFWGTRVAVEQALDRGRVDLALQIVSDTVVPPELEAAKSQIIALFPAA